MDTGKIEGLLLEHLRLILKTTGKELQAVDDQKWGKRVEPWTDSYEEDEDRGSVPSCCKLAELLVKCGTLPYRIGVTGLRSGLMRKKGREGKALGGGGERVAWEVHPNLKMGCRGFLLRYWPM